MTREERARRRAVVNSSFTATGDGYNAKLPCEYASRRREIDAGKSACGDEGAYARPDDPVMCGRIVKDQNSVEIEPETEALEFVDA
jgi:hypothetical protein